MDKNEIKNRLHDEILKTSLLIKEYQEMTKPVAPDVAIGRITRMDAINNKSVTESALRQSEQKFINLNRVLSKIDDKDFGLCLKCRKSIPIETIFIRPESLYCVHCAQ
jgi:DnaK suppressor protein